MTSKICSLLLTLSMFCITIELSGQSSSQEIEPATVRTNHLDSDNLKQGLWIKKRTYRIDSINYQNNLKHGKHTTHNSSGQLLNLRFFKDGKPTGIWSTYNNKVLIAEEVERGVFTDSLRHNQLNYYVFPERYSYVRLYDFKTGQMKSEGVVVYSKNDFWQSDTSRKNGLWLYYTKEGNTLKQLYEYGRKIKSP